MNETDIIEYCTAHERDFRSLDKLVNAMFKNGYYLWGNPYTCADTDGFWACQAMVKTASGGRAEAKPATGRKGN